MHEAADENVLASRDSTLLASLLLHAPALVLPPF